jgi:hypothetical protein
MRDTVTVIVAAGIKVRNAAINIRNDKARKSGIRTDSQFVEKWKLSNGAVCGGVSANLCSKIANLRIICEFIAPTFAVCHRGLCGVLAHQRHRKPDRVQPKKP